MRFLMVDRICELESGKRARGIKNISRDNDFLEETFPGTPVYSPVIMAEAAAQLVSWIILEAMDFTVKPVITMLDTFSCNRHIVPGDRLVLEGEIESFSEESALTNGKILLNGKPVIELNHAVCYLYPLNELEPPERARAQFKNLYAEGSPLPSQSPPRSVTCLYDDNNTKAVKKRIWVDRILDSQTPDKIQGIKNVTATEDFFNDHFPLKPILPGVIIIESIISLAKILIEKKLAEHNLDTKKPILTSCKKIKLRKFIQPGDQLLIEAQLIDFDAEKSVLKAKASVDNKTASTLSIEFVHLDRQHYVNEYIANGYGLQF